jgi:ubiquinone/menaquinone biosynthesis C-methylase UbiE
MPDDPSDVAYTLRLSDAELQRYRLMAEAARASESDLWELAGIADGGIIADIGCGPGAMLPALSQAVGPHGHLSAIDADPDAVAAAKALIASAGLANVAVAVGDAADTGLPERRFDVVMMRHVLAHNGVREQAIVDHLATLARPGGCVFIVDVDGPSMRMWPPPGPVLDEMSQAYARFHAAKGNDLEVGLRLPNLLEAAGLEVLEFRGRFNIVKPPPGMRPPAWAAREAIVADGFATAADVARWDEALIQAGIDPPTLFVPMFSAVGRRP